MSIPTTQTAALVDKQGGPVRFDHEYPVQKPGPNEVLVKVLYSGVCQSDLHTKNGTASGPTGDPITKIKLPHVGGHEGVGRIVQLGDNAQSTNPHLSLGTLLGIRFLSRTCHACTYCLAGVEQYCANATNHLHHEDGAFQEYCCLPAQAATVLPADIDVLSVGPTLCAGVTAYKAVQNADLKPGQTCVVVGAGGGLGHFAVQYALCKGARVIAVDDGRNAHKRDLLKSYGVHAFVDFTSKDVVKSVQDLTDGIGAHAVVVTSGTAAAYRQAPDLLRAGGELCCCGIPPGKNYLETPVPGIVIKGLKISGNLVGSAQETMEAVELVRQQRVRPKILVRPFAELPEIYEMLEKGDVSGRVVVKIAKDE